MKAAFFKHFIFFFLLSLSLQVPLEAAKIHAIFLADLDDEDYGEISRIDLLRARSLLHDIALYSEMEIDEKVFIRKLFRFSALRDHLESLRIDQDDTVFFYYSGKSYRSADETLLWPDVNFPADRKGIDIAHVIKEITRRSPRLSIVITDSPNQIVHLNNLGGIAIEREAETAKFRQALDPFIEKNAKRLFRESRGSFLITSALPSKYSYADPIHGSWFTKAFSEAIKNRLKLHQPARWEAILDVSLSKLQFFIYSLTEHAEIKKLQQSPYHEVKVQSPKRFKLSN